MGTTANKIIARAKSQLGVKESPAGSNRQKYGMHFNDNGVPWCAIFVSWVFDMEKSLPLIGGFDDYTVSMAKWFYNNNQWGKTPKPGAIVFFNFGDPTYGGRWKGIHHVGIVVGKTTDGRVMTIEGNTSAGDNANGGQVQVRYRAMANIAGFGYPKYDVQKSKKVRPYVGIISLNCSLKSHPRNSSKTVKNLKKGQKFTVSAVYGPWRYGHDNTKTYGWVHDNWIKE